MYICQNLEIKLRFRVLVRACVFYRDSSSPDGIQAKLNASMYLKVQSLGFKFAKILRYKSYVFEIWLGSWFAYLKSCYERLGHFRI